MENNLTKNDGGIMIVVFTCLICMAFVALKYETLTSTDKIITNQNRIEHKLDSLNNKLNQLSTENN